MPSGWRLGGEPAWTVHHLRVPGHDPVTVRVGDGQVRVGDGPAVRARLAADGGRVLLHREGLAHAFHHAGDWLGRDGDSWRVQTTTRWRPPCAARRRARAAAP